MILIFTGNFNEKFWGVQEQFIKSPKVGGRCREMFEMTLKDIKALDAADPLREKRDLFSIPEGVIYLDGNLLGVLTKETPDAMHDMLCRQWGQDLIRSWIINDWFNAPRRIGDKICRLIGAAEGQVIAADSTSINIFKALSAAT